MLGFWNLALKKGSANKGLGQYIIALVICST